MKASREFSGGANPVLDELIDASNGLRHEFNSSTNGDGVASAREVDNDAEFVRDLLQELAIRAVRITLTSTAVDKPLLGAGRSYGDRQRERRQSPQQCSPTPSRGPGSCHAPRRTTLPCQ